MPRHDVAEEWRWPAANILPRHLERLAGGAVRPSTWPQGLAPQESPRRPYSVGRRAGAWGGAEARVWGLEADLGRAGTRVAGRPGVPRLVAAGGLDQVGLRLGVERARLARSSQDGQQRLEICALGGPLIADLDGLYAPSQDHARLWLGGKGPMSAAARHLRQQRMAQGPWPQARRGALSCPRPSGSAWPGSGEVVFDPDEPGQHVGRLVFRTCDALGTLHARLRALVHHERPLGVRGREGPAQGPRAGRRPTRMPRQTLGQNPRAAGADADGRRQGDPRPKQPGRPTTGRLTRRRQDYHVGWRDPGPASISWQPYEQPRARGAAHRARADTLGAGCQGPAWRAGLLVGGRCGHRMQGRYGGPRQLHRYTCHRVATTEGGDDGPSLPGAPGDTFVSPWGRHAREPAALPVSWEAATPLERARQERNRLWQPRLQRATDEAARAARQARWVAPAPRLVARPLAHDWEETLTAQRPLQEAYDRFGQAQPPRRSGAACEASRQRAQTSPARWQAPTTTRADRQALVRQVVHRGLVAGEGTSERLQLPLDGVGGVTTAGRTTRPLRPIEPLR